MKNKNTLISIVVGIIGIFLIVFSFFIGDGTDKQEEEGNNIVDNTIVYLCKTLVKEELDLGFTSYQIERISVLDDRVLKSEGIMEIVCNNEEVYLNFKNDNGYSVNKEFIDSEKKITFMNGEIKDYIKDINGVDMILKFSDYEKDLINAGYICESE